jgi:predicted RNase H-like HicB family nuclease
LSSSTDVTIAYDDPDEDGWIVARILDVPGALSQGRTHEEARLNVLDALRTLQTADRHGLQRTPPMHIVLDRSSESARHRASARGHRARPHARNL